MIDRQSIIAIEREPYKRRRLRRIIKPIDMLVYLSVLILVIVLVSIGYNTSITKKAVKPSSDNEDISKIAVDDVVSANVAANIARLSDIPIADYVVNSAVTIEDRLAISNLSSTFKPEVIGSRVSGRSIVSYDVVDGDSLASIAQRFGVTETTIKWANNMKDSALYVGQNLKILPVDGVIYTVKEGDTVNSLVERYKVNQDRLILYNDLDISGLVVGSKIILPEGVLPEDERPGYVQPVRTISYSFYSDGNIVALNSPWELSPTIRDYLPHITSLWVSTPGNGMYQGQCTWWAWERRYAIGRPVPSGPLGNGGQWHYRLQSNPNYTVDHIPEVGAVIEDYTHVAVVETINYNAAGNVESLVLSEMNWLWISGRVNLRTIPGSNVGIYWYIH